MPERNDSPSRYKLISCEIFYREMCHAVSRSPHRVDVEFLAKGLHDIGAERMRAGVQAVLDNVDETEYDAVLLGYGLCNNGLAGLTAGTIPFVLPRAHDCITLFMGSAERYQRYFNDHPGVYFETTGWLERGSDIDQLDGSIQTQMGMDLDYQNLVEKYGEDNAKYLYEQLHGNEKGYGQVTFIEMGVEPDASFEERAKAVARKRDWNFEKVRGDMSLIQRLLDGDWNEKEFLVVPPGQQVEAHYGEGLVSAAPPEESNKNA